MRKNADVVIIGGGIIGMAAAFHLAREQAGQVVVLEKERFLGSCSTAKAAGGIRAQFANRVNIELSMLSEKLFGQFTEDTGQEALFDQVGYMFLLSEAADIETFKKSYELQRSLGLNVELLKQEEIGQYAPHVRLDGIQLATYCPDDGLGDPHEFLSGYEKASRKMGVQIELETEVTGITTSGNAVTKVVTNKGPIETRMVINAAGPFGGLIASMVGTDIKLQPIRRQCVTTGPLEFIKPHYPMVVDTASGLYCHKESQGLLLGWADKDVAPSFDVSVDPDYTDAILERALNLMPQLETAEVANQWAGLYETTPDHRAVIGIDPGVGGMLHLTGFSGHGFMQAPAAGLIAAELVTGKKPSIDIADLSPARFAHGELVEETNVI